MIKLHPVGSTGVGRYLFWDQRIKGRSGLGLRSSGGAEEQRMRWVDRGRSRARVAGTRKEHSRQAYGPGNWEYFTKDATEPVSGFVCRPIQAAIRWAN
ncbi:hypothetical protein BHM03_00000699 [Ensete ventricosum]|uniref:Uncharacterized protein n=1 Tax=Ensete ventricosum TaxID=4639 RepID=A0A445M8N6_ENSVE|nr:hypothetical protein BHM03_00000699 [Ensete ventricosum]